MLYIFDWDGTLCNSLHKIVSCTQAAAQEVGMPIPEDEAVKDIIGLSLPKAIRKVFPGITEETLNALLESYSRQFRADTHSALDFYPGVESSLQALLSAGHQLAVATGKSRKGLDRVITEMGLDGVFHCSRCADETRSKPHPQMLEELLSELSVNPEDAVMIGDTEYDMEMAQRLNMPRIAVSYGAHAIDRLIPFDPILCMDKFDEILAWSE